MLHATSTDSGSSWSSPLVLFDRLSPVGPSASSLARSRGSDDSVAAEQLNIGVVTISGEAAMAHMENSVIDSQRVIEPSWPLACAACGPLPVSCPHHHCST